MASLCAKESKDQRSTKPLILPIYATTSFEFATIDEGIDIFTEKTEDHVYGRYGNTTIESVATKITQMETHGLEMEANGLMLSSGMSAISTTLLALLKMEDKVLTQGNLYG